MENLADGQLDNENARLRIAQLFDQVAELGVGIELSEELRLWQAIHKIWPGLTDIGWPLAEALISNEAKDRLEMKPRMQAAED